MKFREKGLDQIEDSKEILKPIATHSVIELSSCERERKQQLGQ